MPVNRKKSGFVLVLFSLILPVAWLMGLVLLNTGQYYVRVHDFQFLALQSSRYGVSLISDLLIMQAKQNYKNICFPESTDVRCGNSSDIFSFLSSEEIGALIFSPEQELKITEQMTHFILLADLSPALDKNNIIIKLPPASFEKISEISIKTTLTLPSLGWGDVFFNRELSVSSVTFFNIASS